MNRVCVCCRARRPCDGLHPEEEASEGGGPRVRGECLSERECARLSVRESVRGRECVECQ